MMSFLGTKCSTWQKRVARRLISFDELVIEKFGSKIGSVFMHVSTLVLHIERATQYFYLDVVAGQARMMQFEERGK